MVPVKIKKVVESWHGVSKVISTIHSEKEYTEAVLTLDILIDHYAGKGDREIESLIDILGTLIKDYEDRTTEEPEGTPEEILQYLMEEHGLKQTDLKELGSQGVVSEILNGKRKLNIRQIKALSERFAVSPTVFF